MKFVTPTLNDYVLVMRSTYVVHITWYYCSQTFYYVLCNLITMWPLLWLLCDSMIVMSLDPNPSSKTKEKEKKRKVKRKIKKKLGLSFTSLIIMLFLCDVQVCADYCIFDTLIHTYDISRSQKVNLAFLLFSFLFLFSFQFTFHF